MNFLIKLLCIGSCCFSFTFSAHADGIDDMTANVRKNLLTRLLSVESGRRSVKGQKEGIANLIR